MLDVFLILGGYILGSFPTGYLVGQAFGVTRERVRQIETHALRKLKALPEAERLRAAA